MLINFAKFEFSELKAFHEIQDENVKNIFKVFFIFLF